MQEYNILVTGGAGFIGSHVVTALAAHGYNAVILDSLANSSAQVIDRLESIIGTRPKFIQADIRDGSSLDQIFSECAVSAVMHFAGLKAVGESVKHPFQYYDNNVRGTIELLGAMSRASIKTLVFSSSATVYGDPASAPVHEGFPRSATNPYGRSKLMIEEILEDLFRADPEWKIALLRYFNPVGAHESGLIGEDPRGVPNGLMAYIAQVAVGRLPVLNIFGGDYPTPDGTGIRDYIHVMDLADGHIAALNRVCSSGGLLTLNLGTGSGVSVLQMVKAFEVASGKHVPYKIVERRPGDVAECWADPSRARRQLAWVARRSIHQMCADVWRWQSANPSGFSN